MWTGSELLREIYISVLATLVARCFDLAATILWQ
jgi:hypothetical protein